MNTGFNRTFMELKCELKKLNAETAEKFQSYLYGIEIEHQILEQGKYT